MSEKISYPFGTEEFLKPATISVVRQRRYRLNLFLFLLTIGTTLFWGAYWTLLFESSGSAPGPLSFFAQVFRNPFLLWKGIAYSGSILLILLSHEMGHYFACLYYRIHATLPFFLPAPIVGTGTFGAFIRIRSPFPNRKSLFDVGLAGPIAGFVFLVPFLYLGLKWSVQIPMSEISPGQAYFGEPLIFQIFGNLLLEPGKATILHPIGFAVWFACLATSLNLLPIAQLDGGHVSYALFGKKAFYISWSFFAIVVGLAVYGFFQSFVAGFQWTLYALMLLLLRKLAGFRHPPTLDDEAPIGTMRKIWGVIALIVFVLTFVPVTILV